LLEAGIVFTIEPGVYIPGWGGIRIEDDLVVERSGAMVLTKAERSLKVLRHAGLAHLKGSPRTHGAASEFVG
jgi:hypothetical protein